MTSTEIQCHLAGVTVERKLKIFSDACRELYAPGLCRNAYSARCFTFLNKLVPAEFIACGTLHLAESNLELGFDLEHSAFSPAMEALGRLMGKYSLYNWDPTVNDGRPFCRSQFYSDRQFRDLDVYSEVYHPLGIDNHCAVYVETRPGEVTFFGLERNGGADFSPEELGILELAQGQLSNAHALASLFDESLEERVDAALLNEAGLTPREAEILFWMNDGKSNAEIAIILKMSIYTVKDHVTSIFNKSGTGNRLAAVVWGREICHRLRFPRTNSPTFVQIPVKI